MRPSGRILIVDDDEGFLDNYRILLSREGYAVETATTEQQALARLDEGDWDVVLLDQRLLGPRGPDLGTDLVAAVHQRAPGAKPIIVTAYADARSVERAFEAGVYDYLEKKGAFEAILRAKLRNAIEVVRERKLGALDRDQAEAQIRDLWSRLGAETDSNRKGLVLEELMVLLFRSIEGFRLADTRRRSVDEEIDLVIRNESPDPIWSKESSFFLVECKNWSSPVGSNEYVLFRNKLELRSGRARLGFLVAPGNFAKTVSTKMSTDRKNKHVVVCIGAEGLAKLVQSTDRNELLKQLYDRAIVEANGARS